MAGRQIWRGVSLCAPSIARVSLAKKVTRNLFQMAHAVGGGPGTRRALRRHYEYLALGKLVDYVGVDTADGFYIVPTADRVIGRSVYVNGGWEASVLMRALKLADVDLSDKIFLDVGANIGTTTVPAARVARSVIAFEPVPNNFRLLAANVAANELANVRCLPLGLSDAAGELAMTLSADNWGDNRMNAEGEITVAVERLDDAIAAAGVPINDVGFIWIDTQGHEASVLRGAPELLSHGPPVVIEFEPDSLGDTAAELLDILEANYRRVINMTTGWETDFRNLGTGNTDLLCLP
jgi:FkbM family methyltransferase